MLDMMATVDQPSSHCFRLNGLIISQLDPPPVKDGIFSAEQHYAMQPWDMDALLQRASAYAMAQYWDQAIKDYNTILYYQPGQAHVLCLRARAQCCVRKWEKAKEDYNQVLEWYPEDEMSWYGLQDLSQPYIRLPMIDDKLVNDAA